MRRSRRLKVFDFTDGVGPSRRKDVAYGSLAVKLVHLMQHVMNHSTYHRGQLAWMLRQLGTEPRATDFHVFLVEGLHENRAE